ncbi:MAG: orotate phosphoribosyltransferase [archaeon]|nr:orotate phosphoribosyltransferase [archaeon]
MEDLKKALETCGALQFGDFTLASGAKSSYYIDIKKASTKPEVLGLIAKQMAAKIKEMGLKPKRVGGVVLGAIPLATALSLETGIPLLMVRKEKKDHGTGKLVEGDFEKGDEVLMVEDVVTTAGSCIKAINGLREEGVIINRIFSVIDREGGGKENLAEIGVELSALVKGSDLLKDASQ